LDFEKTKPCLPYKGITMAGGNLKQLETKHEDN